MPNLVIIIGEFHNKSCDMTTQYVYLIEAEWRIYASVYKAVIGSYNGLAPVRCQAISWTST